MLRLVVIGSAVLSVLAHTVRARFTHAARASLPRHCRRTLEHLGAPFVKLGQALSMRRDLLPDDIVDALQHLQDDVAGFSGADARRLIEQALGQPIDRLFSTFEETPFAAASIAQVHHARLVDGREVIVKVRRPGIRAQIDRDMRLLILILRALAKLVPAIVRYDLVGLAREIWARLQVETDLRKEAANVRRFVEGLRDQPGVLVPDAELSLCTESVLVQAFSRGRRIDDPRFRQEGPRLARTLVDLYLHQFFVMGVFHGDPHPGNLFVLNDGRLCFHDFGIVGQLNLPTRQHLAMFMLALSHQDEDWLLDTATDLGVLSGSVDRQRARESIGAILTEYAAAPLGEWSLGQVLVRIMQLSRGTGLALPNNLAILARTALLIEQVLRQLDRTLTVVDALGQANPELLRALFIARPDKGALVRLKSEAATVAHDLPALATQWLRRVQREGGRLPMSLRIEALQRTGQGVVQSTDRLALALVTLGLYIAASLLMQHSVGPRILGEFPLLAALGYALALWFTWRVTRGIATAKKSASTSGGSI